MVGIASIRLRLLGLALGCLLALTCPWAIGAEPKAEAEKRDAPAAGAKDAAAGPKDLVTVEFFLGESAPGEGLTEAKVDGINGAPIYLHAKPVLTGGDIAEARPGADNNGTPTVLITMTDAGAAKMVKATGENIGKWLAVVVNGKVISAAIVRSKISDRAQITGRFTDADVQKLARAIDPSIEKRAAENRAAASQAKTDAERLKHFGLALHDYHNAAAQLPDVALRDSEGKPLLSWRVAVLPYLGANELYKQFHRDEPWDSAHNGALIDKMPDVFRSDKTEKGRTRFLAPVGEQLAFPPQKGGVSMKTFTDGTAFTIFVVETDSDHAVVWTQPEDLVVDLENPKRGLTDGTADFWVLLGGSVHQLKGSTQPDLLKALLTRNAGPPIPRSEFKRSEAGPSLSLFP